MQLQQAFPVWVQGQVLVHIKATALQPAVPVARLAEGTELHIAPRPRSQPRKPAEKLLRPPPGAARAPAAPEGQPVWLRVQVGLMSSV